MILAALLAEIGYWSVVILGVGLLIFIHEAGHFLTAKACKVKVLVFSLGFGPTLWGVQRGDTHYRVSAVPLGGYVRMSGEEELPGGGYAPDDFPAKPLWQRALILVAGVVMNALLAFALYAGAFFWGVALDPAQLGTVQAGKPAWEAGLRPGDRILSADGHRLLDFGDLQHATLGGKPVELEVLRGEDTLKFTVTPANDTNIGAPVIGVSPALGDRFEVKPGSAAEKAGFRDGDTLIAVEKVPANLDRLFGDGRLLLHLSPASGPITLTVLRDGVAVDVPLEPSGEKPMVGVWDWSDTVRAVRAGGVAESLGWKAGDRLRSLGGKATPASAGFTRALLRAPEGPLAAELLRGEVVVPLVLPESRLARLEMFDDLHFAEDPSATRVEVLEGSPSAKAGLPDGASIVLVNDIAVARFEDVVSRIGEAAKKSQAPIRFQWKRDGESGTTEVTPAKQPQYLTKSPPGLTRKDDRPIVRVTSPADLIPRAAARTMASFRQILASLGGMFSGTVDSKNLGGVILIGQVARSGAEEGPGRFMWFLAMLSANLAILNLLPIPLLDGGQLVLLGAEGVMGRRPSEGVIAIAQWAGLILILGLMGLGFVNDIGRLIGS